MCSTLPSEGKRWKHTFRAEDSGDIAQFNSTLLFQAPENRGPERLSNLPKFARVISNRTEIRSRMGFLIFLCPDEDEEKWYSLHNYCLPDTGRGA